METIDQVNTVLAGGHISQPLRYISSIFIALAAGMIFLLCICIILSKGRKAKSNELMGAAFTKVEIQKCTRTLYEPDKTLQSTKLRLKWRSQRWWRS